MNDDRLVDPATEAAEKPPLTYRELVELYGDAALPLEYLDLVPLKHGGHGSREEGVCAMELDAWLAGQPHTDSPPCVSSILSDFARTWNDNLGDTEDGTRMRNELIRPLLPRFLGTAGDGQDSARGYLAFDWLVRAFTPAWLELNVPTREWAQTLRDLAPIGNLAAAQAALPILNKAKDSAVAARSAARNAARSAAESAAWNAAESAAESAAWNAAWSAAWNAAWSAAESAAESAAWNAAWSAAWNAAWSAAESAAESAARNALAPTVATLQASARDLLERMIDPSRGATGERPDA